MKYTYTLLFYIVLVYVAIHYNMTSTLKSALPFIILAKVLHLIEKNKDIFKNDGNDDGDIWNIKY